MINKVKQLKNGFTLIEIIASITILGIIVVILVPIFTNVMSNTSQAEDRMITGNLLRQVSEDIREDQQLADYISTQIKKMPNCEGQYKRIGKEKLPRNGFYQVDEREFLVDVSVCQTSKEKEAGLVRAKIKISSPEEKETSQSFTYISGKAEDK